MDLPMLPGTSFNKNLGKERFHKAQHFDYSNGVPMMAGSEKPGIGGEPLLGQKFPPKYSVFPQGAGGSSPPWVAFDKQVLSFDAYLQEAVCQSREEAYRVRKCKIYFYLEDDTIQVVELEFKNSGMTQGTLIRRHRIPLPPPNDDQFYNVYHLNINQDMVLYSRTFKVTDCDTFTRNFLQKLGVRLNASALTPEDPYSSFRQQMEDNLKPLRPYERHDTLKQFLDHDRQVLCFFCLWDDSENLYGDRRELVLHYFLADDTIEIREVFGPNSGRKQEPKFLHRSKLPKRTPGPMHQPGAVTSRTVLNVFGPTGHGGRYILDSLKTGAIQDDFYKDCDLILGAVISVWGRNVLICGCDEFTKEYYRSKHGIEDFTPVQYKAPPIPMPPRQLPPYHGFGSEEDSLTSCQGLLPKPSKKHLRKMMENDGVLRFQAKMVTDSPIDQERLFIISFYLSDDTISVFEPPQKNSGIDGGKFLERSRVRKPGQELFKSEMSEYVKAQDLFVGARLCVCQRDFLLLTADEYTLTYMEQHAEEFPRANIGTILSKLKSISEEKQKEIKKFFAISDPGNTGITLYEPLRDMLSGLDCELSEHEVLTLGRHYRVLEEPHCDLGPFLAVAQDHLKKKHFEEFPGMIRAFMHEDKDGCSTESRWSLEGKANFRTGQLSTQKARTICKTFRLPLPDDLLRFILKRYETEAEEVAYHAFLSGINWRENPAALVLPEDTKVDAHWHREATDSAVNNINYSLLIKDMFGAQGDE